MSRITKTQIRQLCSSYYTLARKLREAKMASINAEQEYIVMPADTIDKEMELLKETLIEIAIAAEFVGLEVEK
jgi:predicted component of type VI protein secretion system